MSEPRRMPMKEVLACLRRPDSKVYVGTDVVPGYPIVFEVSKERVERNMASLEASVARDALELGLFATWDDRDKALTFCRDDFAD